MLNVVLYQPEIPQNTGNVGRTCLAVGAKLWLVRPLGFRLDDYHLRRAGLDYWPLVDCEVVDDWQAARAQLGGDRTMHFFSRRGQRTYTDVTYQDGDVLVFGSETQGLPDSLLRGAPGHVLRIPMRPQVRSLNLASSVAAALYEARRQLAATRPMAPGE
jgi:tRNA (cytidine/uridine-2'-O-)-methyltransferase